MTEPFPEEARLGASLRDTVLAAETTRASPGGTMSDMTSTDPRSAPQPSDVSSDGPSAAAAGTRSSGGSDAETEVLRFAEAVALQDLSTYIRRARRIQEQGIRLQVVGSVLAAWVPVMTPGSLVGRLPAVLGLRTMALAEPSDADVTAELSSITERLARLNPAETVLPLPPSRLTVPWAAVTPPRAGWEVQGELDDDVVRAAAENGIAEITETLPATAGAAVVEQVRERVWGRDLAELAGQAESCEVPAGAAFGAHALNFLTAQGAGGRTTLHSRGRWVRLSSAGGFILCRRSGL
ncbi:hypothetical protein GCM10009674_26830 [Nesterenkonia xinjiangensis]